LSLTLLLEDLKRRGLLAIADGPNITIRGPREHLTDDVVTAVRANKMELLALLEAQAARADGGQLGDQNIPDAEVTRRARLFGQQYRDWARSGRYAIPLLVLPGAPEPRAGSCISCGTPSGESWRCRPCCLEAVELAVADLDTG
jgi:hypothetical protein